MTTFTRTWNAAYEANPADSQNASQGAARIREIKTDVQERMEVDHSHAGDVDDGTHKKCTFIEQASDPASVANRGFLYTKDVGGLTELFYRDSAGSISSVGFPSGTKMLFQQTAAPTGWTKLLVDNDKALRVVTGTVGSGGTKAFTTTFGVGKTSDSYTLLAADIPAHDHGSGGSHSHTLTFYSTGSGSLLTSPGALNSGSPFSPSTGGGGAHTHTSFGGGGGHTHALTNFDLQYMDVIIASKD